MGTAADYCRHETSLDETCVGETADDEPAAAEDTPVCEPAPYMIAATAAKIQTKR